MKDVSLISRKFVASVVLLTLSTTFIGFAVADGFNGSVLPETVVAMESPHYWEWAFSGTVDGENCIGDQFSLPGQDFHYSGSTGGLRQVIDTAGHPKSLTNITDTGELIRQSVLDIGFQEPGFNQKVHIIVLDNFLGVYAELNQQNLVWHLGDGMFNLPLNPTSGEFLDRNSYNGLESELSHGAMVRNHINLAIQSTNLYTLVDIQESTDKWQDTMGSGSELVVHSVNTYGLNTDHVKDVLETKLQEIRNSENNPRIIVNMSFVLIPCATIAEFLEMYEAVGTTDFIAYYNDVLLPQGKTLEDVFEIGLIDPLVDHIDGYGERGVFFVASSGNFGESGMTMPLYPALSGNVLAVSSLPTRVSYLDIDSRNALQSFQQFVKADWSNSGQVMVDGAWYELSDPLFGRTLVKEKLYYAGTSYAAPNMSVFHAVEFAQAAPKCLVGQNDSKLLILPPTADEYLKNAAQICAGSP